MTFGNFFIRNFLYGKYERVLSEKKDNEKKLQIKIERNII